MFPDTPAPVCGTVSCLSLTLSNELFSFLYGLGLDTPCACLLVLLYKSSILSEFLSSLSSDCYFSSSLLNHFESQKLHVVESLFDFSAFSNRVPPVCMDLSIERLCASVWALPLTYSTNLNCKRLLL